MKISILTPDLSHNCLGRAYLLAKILQRRYDVEIVGPMFGEEIWEPISNDKTIEYKYIKFSKYFGYNIFKWIKLYKKIDGDIIYASKPLLSSFGLGLIKKYFNKNPLVLDIDDWEMGFLLKTFKKKSILKKFSPFINAIIKPLSTGSIFSVWLGNILIPLSDKLTVSNTFLKDKYGGKIIVHGRDTETFNPENFDNEILREKIGIEQNKKIVSFIGTTRPYKGVEDLVNAFSLVEDKDKFLLIVGLGNNKYSQKIKDMAKRKINNKNFKLLGKQPFQKLPEFLAISNLIVIPQRSNMATKGQLPAKVFDAMAMAKPIISTKVGDLPEILEGCGWLSEPGNPQELAKTINHVLNNTAKAKEKGLRARSKYIKYYSWDVLEKKLTNVFSKYVK